MSIYLANKFECLMLIWFGIKTALKFVYLTHKTVCILWKIWGKRTKKAIMIHYSHDLNY